MMAWRARFLRLCDTLAGTAEPSFRGRLCIGTILSLLLFCSVLLVVMLLSQGLTPLAGIVAGCVVFYVGLLRAFRRARAKAAVASVLAGFLVFAVGASLTVTGGAAASVTPWVAVVPLLAGLLVGTRLSVVCFMLLALEMVLLQLLKSANLLPEPDALVLDGGIAVFSTCAAALLVAVLSHVDVGARENRERELRLTLQRLEELMSRREQLRKELQHSQNLKALGQLTAGVTHEIKTPLQYVVSNSAFVEKVVADLVRVYDSARTVVRGVRGNSVSADLRRLADQVAGVGEANLVGHLPEAIDDVNDGLARVGEVVEAMRYFVHPGENALQMVDLNRAIQSTVTVTRNEWRYVADLVLDLDPSLPLAAVRPGEMNQVFLNLLVNAAHAIRENVPAGGRGEILVSTRSDERGILIVVSDDGPGIPEEVRSRLFEPFFTTKKVGEGTGQGLALVWSSVVERHGGTINVTSEVGVGTTFMLTLPNTVFTDVACAA